MLQSLSATQDITTSGGEAEHVWENHHPIHWEETTVTGPGQRIAVGEGGPARPDDSGGGVLQLGWRTGSFLVARPL